VVGPVLPASAPVALAIPAIRVRSRLVRLGLTADGLLEVPAPGPHYNEAGWYRYSPAPGSLGPAIIAGHVDSAAEGPSVFFRLGSLHPRDTVLITRADGSVAVFAVDDVHRYLKTRFPTHLVYGDTDHAALRLITCGGPFDRATGNYLDNIVVTASLVRGSGGARPTTGRLAG
jgi:sortase (surface protein transpeptidase)